MDKRLVLVDGYGFLFRAYFAIKNLKRSDGIAVNGVYGFTRMLMDLMTNINASHIAVVFDTGKKTFRHKLYPQYKANRPPVPDDLIPQFSIVRDVVKSLNIRILEKVGYEADDIIATISTKAKNDGFEVLIVSSDKDLMQLIDDKVFMYDAMKNKEIHINDVIEKWGVEPVKVLDVLSLIGDASDNVPGVPSIGPKTATELIKEFDSVENLVNNIGKIKQEKRRNIIADNVSNLQLSKTLITLEKNVELEETLDDLKVQKIEPTKLIKFLDSMEFYSISKKIKKIYNVPEDDLFNEKRSSLFNYKKITTIDQLNICLNSIVDILYIDVLTEKYEDYDNIKTITLIDLTNRYISNIPIDNEHIDLFGNKSTLYLSDKIVFSTLKNILENKNILKVSYNIKKIIRICKKYNIEINNYDDIGLISYTLDAGKINNNLTDLIKEYLLNNFEIKLKNIELNNNILVNYEKNKEITKITEDLFTISCFRIETIYYIYNILIDRLNDSNHKNIYYEIEIPLTKILADMEYIGIKIDIGELKSLSNYFSQQIDKIENFIYNVIGYKFNIGSPKQLGEILFEKLCLPYKKNKNGSYITDNEVLEDLSNQDYKIADKIIEWRHFSKLKSTYSDVLIKLMDNNHRIHTTFLNTNVITGRLSSINPNIQNIPIKTEEGIKIRKTFIARDGYKLIDADYSQIELRILAHYAGVSNLIQSFNNNIDVHTETAKKIFNTDNITPDMRRQAKIINFSIVYGTTAFGLSKRLNSGRYIADLYMQNYFDLYPEIKQYMTDTIDFVKKTGYTKTLFGRKCYIDITNTKGVRKQFAERLAINSPIQGTGADIIKMATINLYNKLKDFDARIVLQVHDELVIEVKEDISKTVVDIVKNTMENVTKLVVPLPVEIKIGNNWGEIH